MQTPWGELAVHDAHVHFFSHGFFSLLAKQKRCAVDEVMTTLAWPMPPEDPVALAGQWVSELDRAGVGRAMMIASLPGDEGSVTAAAQAFPDRLIPAAMVNPREAQQGSRLQGLRTVCLFPAMHGYSLCGEQDGTLTVAPSVQSILDATTGPVFVHCGVLSVGVRRKLGLPSPFHLRYSNPADVTTLAARYPHRPFIIPHFGAGYWREALMAAEMCPNIHLDTSSSNGWLRLQPGELDLATVFRRTLAVTGPERLLFGTDSSFFPRGWHGAIFEEQAKALHAAGADQTVARLVFGGNFERLFA